MGNTRVLRLRPEEEDMTAKNPHPFAGTWPTPKTAGRPYCRTSHESQKQIWTPAELAFQARLLAWCSENFTELEVDLENVWLSESQKSHICACSHAWAAHRTDGADATDSACLAAVSGGFCPCRTFTDGKNSSVLAQDQRSQLPPCTDTSKLTETATRERMSIWRKEYYQANREMIRARQRKYYQKRKRGSSTSEPRVVYGQI